MDEIRKLQEDLARLQVLPSVHRLSERNVIEIVMKVKEMGFVKELFFTDNGKEYITPKQLDREISDLVYVNKGRMNVVDMAPQLGMELSRVEARAQELVKRDGTLILLQGEVISTDYFDNMATEVNDLLQEAGQVTIGDLAKRFGLNTQILIDQLESRMGTFIEGRLKGGVLHTHSFIDRHKAMLRGVFSAITKPTPLSKLIPDYNFQTKLFYDGVQELIDSGRIAGAIQGRMDRAQYVPFIYTASQQKAVDTFFLTNGCIDYEAVKKLGVPNPASWLKQRFSDGIECKSIFVDRSVVEQIDGLIDDAIQNESYCDVSVALPDMATDDDVNVLMEASTAGKKDFSKKGALVGPRVVASNALLQKGWDQLVPFIQGQASRAAARGEVTSAAVSSSAGGNDDDDWSDDDGGRKGRGKKGKSARAQKKAQKEEEQQQQSKGKKGKKGKKGGGGGGGDKGGASGGGGGSKGVSTSDAIQCLQGAFSDIDQEDEIFRLIVTRLKPRFQEVYDEALRSAFSGGGDKRKRIAAIEPKLISELQQAQLYAAAASSPSTESCADELQRVLLRGPCQAVCNLAVQCAAIDFTNDDSGDIMSAEERKALVNKLPGDARGELKAMLSALQDGPFSSFEAEVFKLIENHGIQLKGMDKKTERQMLFGHRHELNSLLEKCEEPAEALHLTVTLLYLNNHKVLIHASPRLIAKLIDNLEETLGGDKYTFLKEFQNDVQTYLRAGDDDDAKQAVLDKLAADMAELKQLTAKPEKE